MICNYLLLCLLSISTHFIASTVASAAIIRGNLAFDGQFPYIVSLQVNGQHMCGGGIIGAEYILTAAHCVMTEHYVLYQQMSIVAGTNHLHRLHEPAMVVEVEKYFYPAEFNQTIFLSDIAVLKLRQPLRLTNHGYIQKLKLPKNQHDDHSGKSGMVAGFGWDWMQTNATWRHGGNSDDRLRYVIVNIVKNDECLFGWPPQFTPEKQMCGRIQPHALFPKGVCNGDSGGPFVDHDKTLLGVLSNGSWDCAEHSPAFFTRISNYLTFIRNVKSGKINKNIVEITLTT